MTKESRAGAMETSFGYRTVGAGDKQPLVDDVFRKVAGRYDVMNDLMSGGLHRLWKSAMIAWLNPPRRAGWQALDVAGGTGDIAFAIKEASGGQAEVTVLDINPAMLEVGRKRAEGRRLEGIFFVEANAEQLPFDDGVFDAYTIAFGIRNVPRMEVALAEAHRVLRHGGRFMCLEFSPEVGMPFLDRAYEAWSFNAIPAIGRMVTGEEEPYRYLVESIRRFPAPAKFAGMIGEAGFDRVKWRELSGGIAAMHSAWKL